MQLFDRGDGLSATDWLPYYDEPVGRERLEAARWFMLENNLARIWWFFDRELHFQAFDRSYRAFRDFLLEAENSVS